jgi:preprotein translocase subunit SecD
VVQLPGVQDTAKAKDILGRTATLEVRWWTNPPRRARPSAAGPVPFGTERYLERDGQPVIVKKQVILTGENLTDAQPGFDADAGAHGQPDAGRQGRAHLQATSRARTSASAWPSCCSRRARARS